MSLAPSSGAAEIYLSRHRVRCSAGGELLRSASVEDPHSIESILGALRDLVPTARAMRIWLSASLCPAVSVRFPHGLRTFAEHKAFAMSYASKHVGKSAAELRVEFDPFNSQLLAVLDANEYGSIVAWVKARRATLLCLRPFWVKAFPERLEAQEAFALIEPDAISMLSRRDDSLSVLACDLADPLEATSALQRMKTAINDDIASPRGIQYVESSALERAWAPL